MDELMNFDLPQDNSSIIKVIGVGGSGGNAVNHMFNKGITGVDFVICNTDNQALKNSPIVNKIQLGATLTEGLGAGNEPSQGRDAAIESYDEIAEMLSHNAKMVFVTAGMGGGTGSGAAPVIAQQAKEMGILTVGIVTLPFHFEGSKRINNAIEGLKEMRRSVDALLVIENDKIREIYGKCPWSQAFGNADDILTLAAKGIAEIITVHGGVNVDFADVKTVMTDSGIALMGSASATGENRAHEAIEKALNSPLLSNNNIDGAKNILLNIISSAQNEASMDEVCYINDFVQDKAGNNADIIWGTTFDDSLGDALSVTVIATGFADDSLSEFLPSEPAKIEKKVLGAESEPVHSAETKQEFTTDFPVNNPNMIEHFTLDDVKMSESEAVQAELKFQFANTAQPNATNIQPMRYGTEQELIEMENQPAYMRQQMQGNVGQNMNVAENISRKTINSDGSFGNNPYLYDNVD